MKITIPNACHENWDAMTPSEKGKFCAVCSKHVHDFRNDTDEELLQFAESNPKDICGTFNEHQIGKNLAHSYINSLITKFAVGFFLTSGGVITATAQQKQDVHKPVPKPQIQGKMVVVKRPNPLIKKDTSRITGEPAVFCDVIQKPLYFVDDKEVSEKIVKSLDQKKIVSMNVLESEKALQIYGYRAKNGAVIVKTK